MYEKYKHIHFIGIGGIGMSGIAEVLLTLGYEVSGSDLKQTPVTNRLRRRGAKIWGGHKASHVNDADVVVTSSAITNSNVEFQEAKKRNLPVVPRAGMLAELMRLKYGVAVAGTHGKTSTTSMIATVLFHSGLDPTMIIGGKVNTFRTNARLGKGEFLVAEADESDRSFLDLSPTIAVITNIEPEHMENYKNFNHMKESYLLFANKVPFYGCVIGDVDHPEVRSLIKKVKKRVVTYAINRKADVTASDIRQVADRLQFIVHHKGERIGAIRLSMVGRHNVANALATIAVGFELEIPFPKIASAFAKFKGIERRFQILKRGPGPVVVSDYAHHPTEIAATIKAARSGWPEKRIVFVHQPHRYSRLKSLFKDFVKVLSEADYVALLPIYAAGEKPMRGIGSRQLLTSLRRKYSKLGTDLIVDRSSVLKWVNKNVGYNDMLIFSGAGDIGKLGKEVARALK
jgi:UDP-N-acetylmuramate--alanine ligase